MSKIILPGILFINILLFLFFTITQHFPLSAVLINIGSIIIIILLLINVRALIQVIKTHPIDIITICGVFLLAFVVYTYNLGVHPFGIRVDEFNLVQLSEKLILKLPNTTPFMVGNAGHATAFFYLVGFAMKLFGRNLWSIRLPSVFFGALSISCFYIFLRHFFRKDIALAASCYCFLAILLLSFHD